MSNPAVLIVEDDQNLREALCETMEVTGFPVVAAADGKQALAILETEDIGIIVSDIQMKPMDGMELLKSIREKKLELPIILMTAYGTIESAVEAMRYGAADYLVKPFAADALVAMVEKHLSIISQPEEDHGVVANDVVTRKLLGLAAKVAKSDATVMLCGESGVGKEVFAQYIHRQSERSRQPFVAVNCAAIPENMLEATLFGYEKGAFTGAYQTTPGKFEQAQGGTILLDEISEMDIALQAKLLRVLQEREVERLGGRKMIPLNVRVLATTNRDLKKAVEDVQFREDLYYRLNVFPLRLPALRERKADILPIAEYLVARHGHANISFSPCAQEKLLNHSFPGNVRELDNLIQRALILKTADAIQADDIHFEMVEHQDEYANTTEDKSASLGDNLKNREHLMILGALKDSDGSRKKTAEMLGISPRTLRYKLARMREMGIELPA